MSSEFIVQLVVWFLNTAISDDVVFNQIDEESAFAYAYAICQFMKDQQPVKEILRVSQKEQDTFKLSHE